jgi:hypothetical protein
MHREIIGLKPNDPSEVDHVNTGHTLDNRRANLRASEHWENMCNQKMRADNTSGRKGVRFDKKRNQWKVTIYAKGVVINLGRYDGFSEACAVREAAEIKYHGEFARKS